jgi:fermentation-respiration switch protein FrsA (DUF1100 family)
LRERLRAEDVELRSPDGPRLHAWLVPARGEQAASTLYLHGNAGNLSHRIDHLEALSRAGSEVLILDYRGYGKSEGSPSEQGLYADAEAGYAWLVEHGRDPARIVIHGESLGTAPAADLASRRECGALVLEAPFPSRAAVAGRVVPLLGPLLARGFETAKKVAEARCPVLVIHGTADGVIPYELGREVFEAAREPKELWTIEGAGHNDLVEAAGEAYLQRMRQLYAGLSGGQGR